MTVVIQTFVWGSNSSVASPFQNLAKITFFSNKYFQEKILIQFVT